MTITQIILLQICAFILILVFAAMFKRHQRIILWSAAIVIFTGTLLLIGLGVIDLIKDNRPNMTVVTGVFFALCISGVLACGAEKLHAKNRKKDKQTIQAVKNHPEAQNASERVVLSGRLDTPLARTVFSKAVEAGYMEEAGSHYSWKGTKVLLAYMCGRIYCGDVPEYSKHEQKSFWKFGNGLFPDVELNALFEQAGIGQSRQNRRDMPVPANAGAGWTFGVIKSPQQVDLYIFAKIITDMVKKMLFLWVRECGQEWSERPHATVQMQGLRTPF